MRYKIVSHHNLVLNPLIHGSPLDIFDNKDAHIILKDLLTGNKITIRTSAVLEEYLGDIYGIEVNTPVNWFCVSSASDAIDSCIRSLVKIVHETDKKDDIEYKSFHGFYAFGSIVFPLGNVLEFIIQFNLIEDCIFYDDRLELYLCDSGCKYHNYYIYITVVLQKGLKEI